MLVQTPRASARGLSAHMWNSVSQVPRPLAGSQSRTLSREEEQTGVFNFSPALANTQFAKDQGWVPTTGTTESDFVQLWPWSRGHHRCLSWA